MAESPARAGPTLVTAAATSQTILTGPGATFWYLLREITVVNVAAQIVTFSLGIGTSNTDVSGKHWPFDNLQLVPNGQPTSLPADWAGFMPLIGSGSTPDLLYAICDTANAIVVTIGYVSGP